MGLSDPQSGPNSPGRQRDVPTLFALRMDPMGLDGAP